MFVDSDHGGDKVSGKLRSGFSIYVNTTLVKWFSKKLSKVKTSDFGAALRGSRYNLRMIGIQISGLSYIFMGTICLLYIIHPDQNQF